MIDIHFGSLPGVLMLTAAAFLAETIVCLLTVPVKSRGLSMGIAGLVPSVLLLLAAYSFAANVLNGIMNLPYPQVFAGESLSTPLIKALAAPDMQAFFGFFFFLILFFGALTAFLLFLLITGHNAPE